MVEGLAGAVVGEIAAIERELGAGASGHVEPPLPRRRARRQPSRSCAARPTRAPACARRSRRPARRSRRQAGARGEDPRRGLRGHPLLGARARHRRDDHGGLLELPADAPLGADLAEYLGLDDWILDVEIMPNRPDVLSVVGVAREVAALTGAPLSAAGARRWPRAPTRPPRWPPSRSLDPDLCPRYAARVITGAHRRARRRRGSPSGCARPGSARSTTWSTSPTT